MTDKNNDIITDEGDLVIGRHKSVQVTLNVTEIRKHQSLFQFENSEEDIEYE